MGALRSMLTVSAAKGIEAMISAIQESNRAIYEVPQQATEKMLLPTLEYESKSIAGRHK